MPFSALVTGANRGIGFGLVHALACGPHRADNVFATCRNMDDCKDLRELQGKNSNLHILQLDITDEASYPRVVRQVSDVVGAAGLNVLINNAGTASRHNLDDVTSEEMVRLFNINCVAPLLLVKAFRPLLRTAAAAGADAGDVMSYRRAAVLNVSSRLGSVADNGSGGFYEYRASKSALNAVTRSLGIELRSDNILAVSFDPGWVRTRLGGANGKMEPQESADRIVDVMTKLTNEHAAAYVDHSGKTVPW